MPTIQIRDIPDDVHRTYQDRAAAAGMSLQEYLRIELSDNARTRTPAEIVAEARANAARRGGFHAPSSAPAIREDRDQR